MASPDILPKHTLLDTPKESFDYDGFFNYVDTQFPNRTSTWSIDLMDHRRLPANIDMFEFLIFVGYQLSLWLPSVGYRGENPLYAPAFPDILLSDENSASRITADSPHKKIPWSIFHTTRRKSPASRRPPFGSEKNWKFRHAGYFTTESNEIYAVRVRRWESLVDFVIIARSGAEVEHATRLFEQFMDMNEGKFLEAGIEKMVPFGRRSEPVVRLDEAGAHYRTTSWWFMSEEFQTHGPVKRISAVDVEYDAMTGETT